MKHCKTILSVGLLVCSASALTEKIDVSMACFGQNFLAIIRQSIEKEARARHVDVQFEDACGGIGCQADQTQSFIVSGVDAIIVNPVDFVSAPQLTKAAQQARMLLVYVNRAPGDKTLPSGVMSIGSDERESDTLQMEALTKLANYKDNVAIMIDSLTDAGTLQRTKDVKQMVAKYPAMKVVQKQPANYSRSEGMDLMQNWAGNGEAIDTAAANNDKMAIDTTVALEKSQKKLLISRIGATSDGLKVLTSDKIRATAFQDAAGQGKTVLAVVLKLTKGEKVESHARVPLELVTKEDMQTYVEKNHQWQSASERTLLIEPG